VSSCKFLSWLWCLLWCIGSEGYLADMVLESGGSIAFDSRSGVSL